jgi:hypothetical protein
LKKACTIGETFVPLFQQQNEKTMKKFYNFLLNIPTGMAFGKLATYIASYHQQADSLQSFLTFLAVVACLALLAAPFCTPFITDCEDEDYPTTQAIAAFVLAAAVVVAL